MSVTLRGHARIDRRSIELDRAIADKLRSDASVLVVARGNLDRWTKMQGRSQPYWDAWREILERPLPEVLQLLEENSERMTAMRQATPFTGILTPAERWAIYSRFSREHPVSE